MANFSHQCLLGLVVLAFTCSASETADCRSSVGSEFEESGQSLLQAKWKRTQPQRAQTHFHRGLHRAQTHFHRGLELSGKVAEIRSEYDQTGDPPLLGILSGFDEQGYQSVAATLCDLQTELYIRRLVKHLDYDVCDEEKLTGMLWLYTGGPGKRSFATLVDHIHATVNDPKCKMAAPKGSCPAQQAGCKADPNPSGHRRRQCQQKKEKLPLLEQGSCTLPEGATLCEVRLKNLPSYYMAVYDYEFADDFVSLNICQAGFWEDQDLSEFGAPGSMLDIGGNLGYHTFAFAAAGWNVTTFEPMAPNLAMISATMCLNPDLASRIHLNRHGLGAQSETCKMISPKNNVGDGYVRCGQAEHPDNFKEVGTFEIKRLDQVLQEQGVSAVDLVKIDVEGYEGQVLAGAPNFLTQYKPRLIKSEVWKQMVNSTGISYLATFENAGYKTYRDTKCEVPYPDATTEMDIRAIDVVLCMK